MASLTKVATGMLVLDWTQLTKEDVTQMATVSARALSAGGVNPVGLQEGDQLSLRDLLYCALMASDNVAATVLAEHVGSRLPNSQGLPPIENFVSHMNALARTLGMNHTRFLNPSGVDNNPESLHSPRQPISPASLATPTARRTSPSTSRNRAASCMSSEAASTTPLNFATPTSSSARRISTV